MARPPYIRLPHSLPGAKSYHRELGMVIDVTDQAEYNEVTKRLATMGYSVAQESSEGIVYTKPKRIGPGEVLAIVVGLFFFLLPGLIFMMVWAAKGQPTICVTKPAPKAKQQKQNQPHPQTQQNSTSNAQPTP